MNAQAADIHVQDLVYEVNGRQILDRISLDVDAGEIVAVMGGSGSGKTSLLRVIMGLAPATGGVVEVMGRNIVGLDEDEMNRLREKMGLVFQYSALFDSLTVAENVGFALTEHRKASQEAIAQTVAEKLKLVGLEGVETLMPDQLSGGMQKKVGIARALAVNPKIILYDEPTSGLDPVSADAIDSLVRELRDRLGVTSVVVSHDVASICSLADRAAMIAGGKIIALGTPEELIQSDQPLVRQFVSRCAAAKGRVTGTVGGA